MARPRIGGDLAFVAVGAASQLIIGGAYGRKRLKLVLASGNAVTLATSQPVVANNGYVLNANQPALIFDRETDGDLAQKAIYGISTGGGATVGIQETYEDL